MRVTTDCAADLLLVRRIDGRNVVIATPEMA